MSDRPWARRLLLLPALAAALLVGALAGTAWASHTNWSSYYDSRWPYPVVQYSYTPSARAGFTTGRVTDAVNQWNGVSGSDLTYQLHVDLANNYDPAAGCPAFTRNGLHWRYIDGTPSSNDKLGVTYRCTINAPTGKVMQNFEIALDSANNFYWGTGTPGTSQTDAWSVLSHEFGHASGWAKHWDDTTAETFCADNSSQNTMCKYNYQGTARQRTLESHDQSLVSAAY